MTDDWSHWLFVGLAGAWFLAMGLCGIVIWAHSRQAKREMYDQPHHVRFVEHEDENEPYDWNQPYDWAESEMRVPESWVREWT